MSPINYNIIIEKSIMAPPKLHLVYPSNFQIEFELKQPSLSNNSPSKKSVKTISIIEKLIRCKVLISKQELPNDDGNNNRTKDQVIVGDKLQYTIVSWNKIDKGRLSQQKSQNPRDKYKFNQIQEIQHLQKDKIVYFIHDGNNDDLIAEYLQNNEQEQTEQILEYQQELTQLSQHLEKQIISQPKQEIKQQNKASVKDLMKEQLTSNKIGEKKLKQNPKQKQEIKQKSDAKQKQDIKPKQKLEFPVNVSTNKRYLKQLQKKQQSLQYLNPQLSSPNKSPTLTKKVTLNSRKQLKKQKLQTLENSGSQNESQIQAQKQILNSAIFKKLVTEDEKNDFVHVRFECDGKTIQKYQVKRLKKIDTSVLSDYQIYYDQGLKKKLAVHTITALRDVVYYCKVKERVIPSPLQNKKNIEGKKSVLSKFQSDEYQEQQIQMPQRQQIHTLEATKNSHKEQAHAQSSIFRIHKKKAHLNLSPPHHLGNSQKLLNFNGQNGEQNKSNIFKLSSHSNTLKLFNVKKVRNIAQEQPEGHAEREGYRREVLGQGEDREE